MTVTEWAKNIINGTGGMIDFERREGPRAPELTRHQRVVEWTLRCLSNPHCEGSAEALAAVIERRRELQSQWTGKEPDL